MEGRRRIKEVSMREEGAGKELRGVMSKEWMRGGVR
jgi:hypothetical protein